MNDSDSEIVRDAPEERDVPEALPEAFMHPPPELMNQHPPGIYFYFLRMVKERMLGADDSAAGNAHDVTNDTDHDVNQDMAKCVAKDSKQDVRKDTAQDVDKDGPCTLDTTPKKPSDNMQTHFCGKVASADGGELMLDEDGSLAIPPSFSHAPLPHVMPRGPHSAELYPNISAQPIEISPLIFNATSGDDENANTANYSVRFNHD